MREGQACILTNALTGIDLARARSPNPRLLALGAPKTGKSRIFRLTRDRYLKLYMDYGWAMGLPPPALKGLPKEAMARRSEIGCSPLQP